MCGEKPWSDIIGPSRRQQKLCDEFFDWNLCHSHAFVLLVDLLHASEAWDDLLGGCSFYSVTLRRLSFHRHLRQSPGPLERLVKIRNDSEIFWGRW